jgi:hypothetical protein
MFNQMIQTVAETVAASFIFGGKMFSFFHGIKTTSKICETPAARMTDDT